MKAEWIELNFEGQLSMYNRDYNCQQLDIRIRLSTYKIILVLDIYE